MWMGLLERLVAALTPSDAPGWEIHFAIKHDQQVCAEIHLDSCTRQDESETPAESSSPVGAAGYL